MSSDFFSDSSDSPCSVCVVRQFFLRHSVVSSVFLSFRFFVTQMAGKNKVPNKGVCT